MEVKRFRFSDRALKALAREIRTDVFVEEQQVPIELEYDEFDASANHYLLFTEHQAIATARWRKTDKGIKLERFALLKEFRNQGLGSVLLDAVLEDVVPLKQNIYLHAQLAAVNYYQRKGFAIYGEEFEEAGIKHVRMKYRG